MSVGASETRRRLIIAYKFFYYRGFNKERHSWCVVKTNPLRAALSWRGACFYILFEKFLTSRWSRRKTVEKND